MVVEVTIDMAMHLRGPIMDTLIEGQTTITIETILTITTAHTISTIIILTEKMQEVAIHAGIALEGTILVIQTDADNLE